MLSRVGFPMAIVRALTVLSTSIALSIAISTPSRIFGIEFGRPHHKELRVRLVAHGIPDYKAWLAANKPYFDEGAPAAYPPEAGMFAHREVFFLSPVKDQMFYILFFEPEGEPVIKAAFSPDSEAWKQGEAAGILVQPVSVVHMDADELWPGDTVELPKPGSTFQQPDAWPDGFPSIDGATLKFDCPVDLKTGGYECL